MNKEATIMYIHTLISTEYRASISTEYSGATGGMNRMFWACERLERVKKRWGLTPPKRGYTYRPAPFKCEDTRGDDYINPHHINITL